jgi:hypothetical protein
LLKEPVARIATRPICLPAFFHGMSGLPLLSNTKTAKAIAPKKGSSDFRVGQFIAGLIPALP